jgi:polysaccharide biosynthesis/export protein
MKHLSQHSLGTLGCHVSPGSLLVAALLWVLLLPALGSAADNLQPTLAPLFQTQLAQVTPAAPAPAAAPAGDQQTPAPATNQQLASPSAPGTFGMPLQPGDIISVTVIGEPELTGQYAVREDGQIIFPILGATKVIGYTPTQLADQMTEMLRKFVLKPIVAVTTLAGMPRIASIMGEVVRSGVYDLRSAPTLLALLSLAGGTAPMGDITQAVLVRKGEIVRLIPDGATGPKIPRNIPLEPGDSIYVPSRELKAVMVMGAVRAPGPMAAAENVTAGRAVLMSGGPLPEGDAAAAYVLRAGKQLPIDLSPFTQANPPTGEVKDMPLEAGDILVIPNRSDATIYVAGEVKLSGPLPYVRAPLASAAVALAGGLTENANGREAYILRHGQKTPVDLQSVLQEGKAEADQAMQPGDVLVIPKQLHVFYLIGQIAKPGPQPLALADTVMSAWALAGGASPEADLRNVILLHNDEAKRLDIEALVDRGDMQYNLKLEPGDQLIVPRLLDEVYVLGQVMQPGPKPIHKGDTLIDVVARAGGPNALAQIDAIALVRRATPAEASAAATGSGGGATAPAATANAKPGPPSPAEQLQTKIDKGLAVRFVDLAKVQPGEEVYLARPGDVIYVPALREKQSRDWLQTVISLASGFLLGRR